MEKIPEKKNVLLWVVLTFVVAPFVSNALWEFGGRRFLNYISYLTLNLLSNLFSHYRDSIYMEISNGFHESSSLAMFICLILTIMTGGIAYGSSRYWKRQSSSTKYDDADIETLNMEIKKLNDELIRAEKKLKIAALITISYCSLLIIPCLSAFYVNGAITGFNKDLKVLAPYITDSDKKMIESKFYQMKSKKEFVEIQNTLNSLANKNKVALEPKWIL